MPTDEARFLEVVRSSLEERGRDSELPGSPRSPVIRDESLSDRLGREVETIGGSVHRVRAPEDAREKILELLAGVGATQVVRSTTNLVEEVDLDDALRQRGVEVMACDLRRDDDRKRLREMEFSADAGVTTVDYGVAETGSLVVVAAPGQGRAVSLLPPVHIAVLRASDIVYELGELFERIKRDRGELPSATTLITGPSRTADIELVLTVGVHGPKELHLVLLDDGSSKPP
jgi:L-lactate dehydrogenase complex protein LldG